MNIFGRYKKKLKKIKIYIGTKTTYDFFRYKKFLFFNVKDFISISVKYIYVGRYKMRLQKIKIFIETNTTFETLIFFKFERFYTLKAYM